jgi:tetratricopeptide (TPR) repeat protein
VNRYIGEGAGRARVFYTDPRWQLYCDSVLAICENIAEAYQMKALPFVKYGDFLTAMPLLDKAVLYDTLQYLPYRAFIKCIFAKDYDGAITDFNLCQRLARGGGIMDHSYSFYLGLSYLERGEADVAWQYIAEDIKVQQDRGAGSDAHFNSWLYAGIVHIELNKPDSAKYFLQQCLSRYPQHPEGNYYMARVLQKLSLPDDAQKHAEAGRAGLIAGYRMNEDNIAYVNYPRQVTVNDFDALMLSIGNK